MPPFCVSPPMAGGSTAEPFMFCTNSSTPTEPLKLGAPTLGGNVPAWKV